jgi:hypothetical protein
MSTDIQNLKSFDPFAEAEDAGGEVKVSNQQNYIHIRIQRMYSPSPLHTSQTCSLELFPTPISTHLQLFQLQG